MGFKESHFWIARNRAHAFLKKGHRGFLSVSEPKEEVERNRGSEDDPKLEERWHLLVFHRALRESTLSKPMSHCVIIWLSLYGNAVASLAVDWRGRERIPLRRLENSRCVSALGSECF